MRQLVSNFSDSISSLNWEAVAVGPEIWENAENEVSKYFWVEIGVDDLNGCLERNS